jgi:hypothetical protein
MPTENDAEHVEEIGGINHIPGFSVSEERLLEYYDVTQSSTDKLVDGAMSSEEEESQVVVDKGTLPTVDEDLFTDVPFDLDDQVPTYPAKSYKYCDYKYL